MTAVRVATIAVLLAAVQAAPAAAAPTAGATYGGGAVSGDVKKPIAPGGEVSVEVNRTGTTATVHVVLSVVCDRKDEVSPQRFETKAPISADGRISTSVRTAFYSYGSVDRTPRGRATVGLTLGEATGSGRIDLSVSFRSKGRRVKCRSDVPIELRVVGEDASPTTPPAADGVLFGLTDNPFRGVRTPILLWLTRGGTRIETTLFRANLACPGRRVDTYLANISRPKRIGSDGSFAIRERFTTRFTDATTVTRVRIDGRFTAQGATGTLRATEAVDLERGRDYRCDSGEVRWSVVR